MTTRVLVTGATGFVGSHIIEALQQQEGVEVIAACRDRYKLLQSFSGEVREGDLLDKAYTVSLVQNVDVICHAAAWSSMWGHKSVSETLFYEPSIHLINAAKEAGVKKFIFTSSTSMADPSESHDALSLGSPRSFWPHMQQVIKIENYLREHANEDFQAITLRCGVFIGRRYELGLLPILLPRLKTHLVPWIEQGRTHLPLIDGRDIAQAFVQTIQSSITAPYEAFNIIGNERPSVREVITFLHETYHYPLPHFSVPFFIAYAFGWLTEKVALLSSTQPFLTRSIVYLMEDQEVDNTKATTLLGYEPKYDWKESIREQVVEYNSKTEGAMQLAKPY